MRCSLFAVAAVALALAGAPGADGATAQPALGDYALLGLEGVALRGAVRVQSGAVGAVTGEVRLAPGVRVQGRVAGDVVRLGSGTKVGRLFCRLVSGGPFGHGVVGGPGVEGGAIPGCAVLVLPLVDPALLPPVQVSPGPTEVRVPPRTGTAPIPAGQYADVLVGAGSLLQLAGGTYEVGSIQVGRDARLVCIADCRISVLNGVRLRRGAELGAAVPLRASKVRLDVAASDGGLAFRAAAHTAVAATVYAPAGDLVLGRQGSFLGAYVGRSIVVGADARVRGDSAL